MALPQLPWLNQRVTPARRRAATSAVIARSKGMAGVYAKTPGAFNTGAGSVKQKGVKPLAPAATTPATTAPGAAAPPAGWDPSADPYMMGLTGQYNQDIAGLQSKSLEEKKRILLGFGSQELARSVLGNDPFVGTISDNPDTSTSTLGQLGYQYRQQQQGFNETSNAQNLFYGGGRGVGLRNLAHQNLIDVANATTTARGQLTASDDVVANAQREWGQRLFQGQWDAYKQWLTNRGVGAPA